jgi:hypothetical protein
MYSSSLIWTFSPQQDITIPVPGNQLPFMNNTTSRIINDALNAPAKAFNQLVKDDKLFCPYCKLIPTYNKGACCGMCMMTYGISHSDECLKIHRNYFMPVMAVHSPVYANTFSTVKDPIMPANSIVSVSPTNQASVISPYAVPIVYNAYGGDAAISGVGASIPSEDEAKWKQKYLKYKAKYLALKNK